MSMIGLFTAAPRVAATSTGADDAAAAEGFGSALQDVLAELSADGASAPAAIAASEGGGFPLELPESGAGERHAAELSAPELRSTQGAETESTAHPRRTGEADSADNAVIGTEAGLAVLGSAVMGSPALGSAALGSAAQEITGSETTGSETTGQGVAGPDVEALGGTVVNGAVSGSAVSDSTMSDGAAAGAAAQGDDGSSATTSGAGNAALTGPELLESATAPGMVNGAGAQARMADAPASGVAAPQNSSAEHTVGGSQESAQRGSEGATTAGPQTAASDAARTVGAAEFGATAPAALAASDTPTTAGAAPGRAVTGAVPPAASGPVATVSDPAAAGALAAASLRSAGETAPVAGARTAEVSTPAPLAAAAAGAVTQGGPVAPAAVAQGAAEASAPLATQLARPLFSLASAGAGEHTMTISVTPEELGPVTVRAQIGAEGVRVELFAPNDQGRDAIRAILTDLRRDLAGSGLGGNLNLSSQNQPPAQDAGGQAGTRHPDAEAAGRDASAGANAGREPATETGARQAPARSTTSTIDVMA